MDGKLLVRLRLASRAAVGGSQIVVRAGIRGLEFHGCLERRNGFGKLAAGDEGLAQAEKRIAECGIELGGAGKVFDGLVPVLVLAG